MAEGQRIPQLRKAPRHLQENHGRRWLFIRWANFIRGLYGVPIYLVGSALQEYNSDPRDWDIRIRLSNEAFRIRFGDPDDWTAQGGTGLWTRVRWRWADECVKRTKNAWRHIHENVDFQIYPPAYWRTFAGLPRLRLDTR